MLVPNFFDISSPAAALTASNARNAYQLASAITEDHCILLVLVVAGVVDGGKVAALCVPKARSSWGI